MRNELTKYVPKFLYGSWVKEKVLGRISNYWVSDDVGGRYGETLYNVEYEYTDKDGNTNFVRGGDTLAITPFTLEKEHVLLIDEHKEAYLAITQQNDLLPFFFFGPLIFFLFSYTLGAIVLLLSTGMAYANTFVSRYLELHKTVKTGKTGEKIKAKAVELRDRLFVLEYEYNGKTYQHKIPSLSSQDRVERFVYVSEKYQTVISDDEFDSVMHSLANEMKIVKYLLFVFLGGCGIAIIQMLLQSLI